MKTCFKCGERKPLSAFYRHSQMADGHLNKCKECTKADVHSHREANIERIREYDRRRSRTPDRIASNTKNTQEYRRKNPDRYRATTLLNNAVRDGKIRKPKRCEECRKVRKLHGHHDDYSKPLDVRWLCRLDHVKADRQRMERENAAS